MDSMIFLPPLHTQSLDASSPVTLASQALNGVMTLSEAITRHPKARVILHPSDAPMKVIQLPPLSGSRRDAALRVKLEDDILGDVSKLHISVLSGLKNVYTVSYINRAMLSQVMSVLNGLSIAKPSVQTLSSLLPPNSAWHMDGWTVWRDTHGAGAIPAQDGDTTLPKLDLNALAQQSKLAGTQFSPAINRAHIWQQWRWGLVLAVLCGVCYIAGSYWHWRQLLTLEKTTHSLIAEQFKRALPDTPMVDATLQLTRAAQGGTALSKQLQQLPEQWPTGSVTQLKWVNNRLSVTVDAKKAGVTAAQQSAEAERLAAKNITVNWKTP